MNELPGIPHVESPCFDELLGAGCVADKTAAIARSLHQDGFAVIDFPDPLLGERIGRIIGRLSPRFDLDQWRAQAWQSGAGMRIQDFWRGDPDVCAIAANAELLQLLSRLYGRRAFPFQTLNFPVGTQQHFHTDSMHFNSVPERFMCGVWLAFEDTDADNGPLIYYPGSHRWPIYGNEHIGLVAADAKRGRLIQPAYHAMWEKLVAIHDIEPVEFHARRGQALIWAANLLHGGARQRDPMRTRWSQVTHYYFDDCVYYTPMQSDVWLGNIKLRQVTDIATGRRVASRYNGYRIKRRHRLLRRLFRI